MRVEKEAAAASFGGPVEFVASDGVADAGEVDADLVGAAGADVNFEQGVFGEAADDAVFGMSGAALVEACGHAGAVDGVARDLCFDCASVARYVSVYQGDVGFVYLSGCELFGKVAMSGVCAGD